MCSSVYYLVFLLVVAFSESVPMKERVSAAVEVLVCDTVACYLGSLSQSVWGIGWIILGTNK